eukprot:6142826-Pleurochrysis_carterae.AAC.1
MSTSMASRTTVRVSSMSAPRRVRRSFAARRTRSMTSAKRATPLASDIEPSALLARRASSERWKSGAGQRTPPPAIDCAMPRSSPSTCTPP